MKPAEPSWAADDPDLSAPATGVAQPPPPASPGLHEIAVAAAGTGMEAADGSEAPPTEKRQLHPLPAGLVELYGFLAVLIVLVPEWMASGALFGFREGREGLELPPPSGAWQRVPELRLASLNLAELRQLAQRLRLRGYGRLSRSALSSRLLQRLRKRP